MWTDSLLALCRLPGPSSPLSQPHLSPTSTAAVTAVPERKLNGELISQNNGNRNSTVCASCCRSSAPS
jgi:hypothetical protein